VLSCVTQARLALRNPAPLEIGTPLSLVLNNFDPVPLRGAYPLLLAVERVARIVPTGSGDADAAFDLATVRYSYQITTREDAEVLAFHWTPDAASPPAVTYPHLHIGRALVAGQTALRLGDLHKARIPTGVIPLAAVIRMAITEFGVTPLRPNWDQILRPAENSQSAVAP